MRTTTAYERIRHSFQRFHERNPLVYKALVEHALALKAAGVERYSIKALFEVVRYNAYLDTTDPNSPWKLNNNYTAEYARKIMKEHPILDGFFRTRECRSRRRVIPLYT